jgi:hypothetical protein
VSDQVEDVLLEIIDICEALQIPYAVMGGIAVRVHGIPRPTYDVDVALSVSGELLERFFTSANQLGYSIAQPFRSGWRDSVGGMPVVKMRTYLAAGHGIDVDLFLDETPFQHSLMARRQVVELDNRKLNFVSAEDLILLKLLAHRPRDLGDVADVLFIQGALDEAYMRQWAEHLGILDRLENALEREL